MSTIKIDHPFDSGDVCAACLDIQLTHWRNHNKETWNRYNNDGKRGMVHMNFTLNPSLLWDEPITMVNGSPICLTHKFVMLNAQYETAEAQRANGGKPGLLIPQGDIQGFLKKGQN